MELQERWKNLRSARSINCGRSYLVLALSIKLTASGQRMEMALLETTIVFQATVIK